MSLFDRLLTLLRSRRLDREMGEELRAHLDRETEQNLARGLPPEEARYAALRAFGGVEQIKERARDARGGRWLSDLCRDVAYALRQLRRQPGFATTIVVTLALGIGANATLCSVVYALMLRPLPVPQPAALRFLVQQRPDSPHHGFSFPAFSALSTRARSIGSVGAFISASPSLVSVAGGPIEQVHREYVSASYFTTLGLVPAAGRFFTPEEDTQDSTLVVIGYDYWVRQFNRNPAAIGASLNRDGRPFTIVGVAPAGFAGLVPEKQTQVWFQISQNMWRRGRYDPAWGATDHTSEFYRLVLRLHPGVTDRQAEAAFEAVNRAHLQERASGMASAERAKLLARTVAMASASSGISFLGHQYKNPLVVLLTLEALLLLLVCLNIGALLLARAEARSHELAIRVALGAGRGRLVSMVLAESLTLAGLGGFAGYWVAWWGAPVLANVYELTVEVRPGGPILALTALVTLGCAALFGSLTAWWVFRFGLASMLQAGSAGGARRPPSSRGLLVGQTAFSLVLLFGAVLFARNLARIHAHAPGFLGEQIVLCDLITPVGRTPVDDAAIGHIIDLLRGTPGVLAAGAGRDVPGSAPPAKISIDGYAPHPDESMNVSNREIADGYFETLGIPLVTGRFLNRRDGEKGAAAVAVVNESFARRFLAGANPLGRRVEVDMSPVGGNSIGRFEIVGVVADVRLTGLKHEPTPELYLPSRGGTVLVRTDGDPRALMAALPNLVQQAAPGLRVHRVRTLAQAVNASLAQDRMLAGLAGGFGILALLVAALGIHGLVAHGVNRRTREIAIRTALGASRSTVLWMIVREASLVLAIGLVCGVLGVLAGGRLLTSLLFELEAADPMSMAVALAVLSGGGLLAAWLPARRAARVDPITALRAE